MQNNINTKNKLPILFPKADYIFPLDSTYEPEAEPKGHENEETFLQLQRFNRNGLLLPVDEEHMYFAAINNKSCILTPLGKYYWKLCKEDKI